MPYYTMQCTACSYAERMLLKPEQVDNTIGDCGHKLERLFVTAPTSQVKEVVDNGFMPRRVEILKK